MLPSSLVFDQSTVARMLEHDPQVQGYRALFNWQLVEQWEQQRSTRG